MAIIQDCTYEALDFDEACILLSSLTNNSNLWLYTLSSDCDECPYTRSVNFPKFKTSSVKVNTAWPQFWRVIETLGNEEYIPASIKKGLYCELTPQIGEYGIYELTVNHNNSCDFQTHIEPNNSFKPLYIAIGSIILLLSVLSILKTIKNYLKAKCMAIGTSETVENSRAKTRVQSLDTVRGASILLMIFVNNGAGGYPLLEHATWNGLLVGDLVFPCFMWIMGVCIPLSISSQLSRGTSKLVVCFAIVKRSIYLFVIGVFLNTLGKTNVESIRIFGVLQRFSVAYLVAAMVYTLIPRLSLNKSKHPRLKLVADIVILLPRWIVPFLMLAAHCLIIFLLSVPDCPKGYLGPGGIHRDGKYWNCTGGATGYIDKIILGQNHVYQFPTISNVYKSGSFDPEGILGCLTSIFHVFLGIQAGQILREYKSWKGRLLRWLLWALILGLFGATLHYFNIIPINKNLWSISFVMITTCFSLVLLSTCYYLIDVVNLWHGGPFRIPGMNALLMYVGHQIFSNILPFHWKIGKMNTHGWLLAESLWCVALWTCIAYVLHRKKIYVTL